MLGNTSTGHDEGHRSGTQPARAPRVMLVGFQRQGNLGLGYLASTLMQHGCIVEIHDFEAEPAVLLQAAYQMKPDVIGFSLIFQFYIRHFGQVIRHLRDAGITSHFTMGGHYPTLNSRQTMETVPELDSIVRFEGELTLVEMAEAMASGHEWRNITGIAFRANDGAVIETPARKLIHDLDELPYPVRSIGDNLVVGQRAIPLLASRGCARTCSFCSIHTFYRTAPGKVVRTRRPAKVVAEMLHLHETTGATIFLFQDDDFPLFGKVWREWSNEFVDELHRAGLPGKVIWKINCRADAVEPGILARMRDAGLFMVYMGLESGSEQGLKTLNKGISVQQNLQAVATLKQLGIMFEFGFMLLDPSSTFETVAENLDFLKTIVSDGSAAAVFCKMLPYDGTPIKAELEQTGRLLGDVCSPNYNFLDPRLDEFYEALAETVDVTGWIHGHQALSLQLNWAWNELAVMKHMTSNLSSLSAYSKQLTAITRQSNALLFEVVERLAGFHKDGSAVPFDNQELKQQREAFISALVEARNRFVGKNQDQLLAIISSQENRSAA